MIRQLSLHPVRVLKDSVVGVVWIGTDVQGRRILDPRSANRGLRFWFLHAILLPSWSAASRFQVPLDLFCGLSPHQGDGRRSLLVIVTAISLLALFSWEPQPVSTWLGVVSHYLPASGLRDSAPMPLPSLDRTPSTTPTPRCCGACGSTES